MAGKVIILCAPSGSGKTTLAKHLLSIKELDLKFSVSATTRKKRDGETDGLDYNFLSIDEFKNRIHNNKSLFFKVGLGILAKSENSLTKFSICLI